MKSMTKKLLVLITGILLLAVILSSCGIDSSEANSVSDSARREFIDQMLYAEGAELLYAPQVFDEEGNAPYHKWPEGYSLVSKSEGAMTGLTNMSKILSNDRYELYIDFQTTDIALLDKETKQAFHSNVARDPDGAGIKAIKNGAGTYGSPLSVEAYDASGKRYSFNFYDDCWDSGSGAFYVVKNDDDSVRLIYTIGNDPDKELFPPVITEDTWNNRIIKGLNELYTSGQIDEERYEEFEAALNKCYCYMTPKGMTDEERKIFESTFPSVKYKEMDLETRERFRETFPTIDVMTLYVSYDKPAVKLRRTIKELMESIGFTAQDVKLEIEKADYQGPERSVLYTIPVDLSLNEYGLSVNVDTSLILGPTKQRLFTINVYRGFGANVGIVDPLDATRNQGYMIVPDGSGAVIPVKGSLTTQVYKSRIYGADGSFSKEYSVDYSEQALAPYLIYDRGVVAKDSTKLNGGGVVAVVEEGAGQVSAIARPIGSGNAAASINYEIVYSERDYRTYSTSFTGNVISDESQTGSGLLLSKDDVTGNYKIQYLFTEGGLSYSDYAAFLRDYFIKTDRFPKETLKETELPFFLDLLGCVDLSQTFIGVPVQTETALTTYSQAQTILSELKAAQVNNVVSRYTYWANGGENNTFAEDLVLLDCMGSKEELDSLVEFCQTNDYGFFPSVEFLHVTSTGNGFSTSQDAARRMNRSTSTIVERMNAIGSLREDLEEKILLSSKVSAEISESYKASFEEVISSENKSIALGNLGQGLHSNYKTNEGVSRFFAEKDHVKIMETFAKDGYDIAVSTGNFYTWKYASHIFGLSTGSSEYFSQDTAIPFVQQILHGYVNYSMEPVNKTGDYNTALLLALETGSAPSFRWMGAEDSVFDYTPYYNYFSLNYQSTFDRAVKLYKEIASVLNDVVNEPITEHMELDAYYISDHEGLFGWNEPEIDSKTGKYVTDKEGNIILTPADDRLSSKGGVFATVYGDKKVIIVNYNSFDVELNNRMVMEADSYKVCTMEEFEEICKENAACEPRPEIQQIGENQGQEG